MPILMSNAPLESKIERAFQDDVIFKYPSGTSLDQLKHVFVPTRKNAQGTTVSSEGFYRLKEELEIWHNEFLDWHRAAYGAEFDPFAKGPEQEKKKEVYRQNPRFKKAFEFIGVDWNEHKTKTYLPWWREVLASQVSHLQLPDGSYQATFAPMSPLELQIVKRGLALPVQATSTLGILITQPDAASKDGYVTLGVRTGSGHPNTYHVVPAGYLQASHEFMKGEETIYDGFVKDELTPESGLTKNDIEETQPLAIVHDHLISNGGPEYTFYLRSKLTKEQVRERWFASKREDRSEHADFVFVPATPEAVQEFLSRAYVGAVENRANRTENERYILHPAALALAAYAGMSLSELKSYCNGREN